MYPFRAFLVGFCIICFCIGMFFVPSAEYKQSDCAQNPIVENTSSSEGVLGAQPKADRSTIDYQQKSYDVSCANLKAQWLTTDAAHKTFWITLMGLTLLGFTLYETLKAGKLISKQNEISLMTSELELQPYLGVSGICFRDTLKNVTILSGGSIILDGSIFVTNNGKTPIYIRQYTQSAEIIFLDEGSRANRKPKEPSKQFVEIPPSETRPVFIILHFNTGKNEGAKYSFDKILFSTYTTIEYDDLFSLRRETAKSINIRHRGKIEETSEYDKEDARISSAIKLGSFSQSVELDSVHPSKMPV